MKRFLQRILASLGNSWNASLIAIFRPLVSRSGYNDAELVWAERMANPLFLERYGFKVYSQNDEDGIIEEIFRRIEPQKMGGGGG
ncbi:hypothetical protein AGMMS50229_13410 [Campylobacterota bacterium]|nr:hypothetical protein AGMMS50229_13410 [Campylobacterota bacterium]